MTDIENKKWEDQLENKIISSEEIGKIESIANALKTPEGQEQTKKILDQVDDDFLDDIKKQALNILNWHVDNETAAITYDEVKAIRSLLKIQQIKFPWSIAWDIKIDGEGWVDSILAIVWTKPENFSTILWEKAVSILRKFVDSKKKEEEAAYNQETESFKNKDNLEVKGNIPPERARVYIENLLNDPEITWTVSQKFQKIREKFSEDDKFPKAIDSLMNYCASLWTEESPSPFKWLEWSLNLKNMTSEKVRTFQKMATKDEELAAIISEWFAKGKDGVDWKLWANTISAILKITNALERRYNEKTEDKVVNDVEAREVDKWGSIDKMPTTIVKLKSFWSFWTDNKFSFFDWTNNPDNKDYIQSLTGNENTKFVNIEWKKFFIEWWWDNDLKFMQTQEAYKWRDKDWNEITLYKQNLSFWKFDSNGKLLEWTTITIDADWKQIQATTFDTPKRRSEGEPPKDVEWQMAAIRLWNKIDEEWNFRWKWRIDLFTDDDTKRLNKDQLNSLDAQDITFALDQAISAYVETNHKPSEVWRYNLNRIVYNVMHRTGGFDNLNAPFDTPKTVSHIILWMETWFYTNPDKDLTKDNLNEIDDDKLMQMLKISKDKVDWYKKLKYDWSEKKCDQIVNRLNILKAFVEENKTKLENKKN